MSYLPSFYTKIVQVSAAQLLTLNTAPIQLVAGKPGQVLVLESSYIRYNYNTTPFNPASGDKVAMFIGNHDTTFNAGLNQDSVGTPAVGFVDQTENTSTWMLSYTGNISGAGTLASAFRGSGLYLTQYSTNLSQFPSGTNWTHGDGTLSVFVRYGFIEA